MLSLVGQFIVRTLHSIRNTPRSSSQVVVRYTASSSMHRLCKFRTNSLFVVLSFTVRTCSSGSQLTCPTMASSHERLLDLILLTSTRSPSCKFFCTFDHLSLVWGEVYRYSFIHLFQNAVVNLCASSHLLLIKSRPQKHRQMTILYKSITIYPQWQSLGYQGHQSFLVVVCCLISFRPRSKMFARFHQSAHLQIKTLLKFFQLI